MRGKNKNKRKEEGFAPKAFGIKGESFIMCLIESCNKEISYWWECEVLEYRLWLCFFIAWDMRT
jgi:hypothetical protein